MQEPSKDIARIRELTEQLRAAAKAYYADGVEIMPNLTYDRLYDELAGLEKKTGFSLASSPTKNVGYEVVTELPKERHASPMLSLDKTKSPEALAQFLNGHEGMLSWKLDGLTVVLSYEGGSLVKAVTRGNGEVGEVVTGNARFFENLPGSIPYEGSLTLRGEAVIGYRDFEKINREIPDADARYKNPRNLCSGSVRQLDPSVTAGRHVKLIAFSLVSGGPELPTYGEQLAFLAGQGFEVVEHTAVTPETVEQAVLSYKARIAGYDLPSDGLVLMLNDLAYGRSLGRTAKFPRNSIAFKWQDELAETVLREIEFSASRTGLINPIAVFDPVELEGTTVSRASLHNLSIIEELALGIGDRITVYKANMIIPQIAENLTKSGNFRAPETCPVCGGPAEVRKDNDSAVLFCPNPDCPAKHVKGFSLLVSRDALNVEGLSEQRLSDLIGEGLIKSFTDLFRLSEHKEKIVRMEGYGEKSFENLVGAAEKARHTELFRLLYGLGIPGIGLANAKLIARHFGNDWERVKNASFEELCTIPGMGEVLSRAFTDYFADEKKRAAAEGLRAVLELPEPAEVSGADRSVDEDGAERTMTVKAGEKELTARAGALSGLTFVVTGDVHVFKNRAELTEAAEALGGKCTGSVSAKTSYLINNDILSTSGKNRKARELGIPVIGEEEFLKLFAQSELGETAD